MADCDTVQCKTRPCAKWAICTQGSVLRLTSYSKAAALLSSVLLFSEHSHAAQHHDVMHHCFLRCCETPLSNAATGNCIIMQSRFEEAEVAWEIIRKGPERLQSQFAAGYSMVLNLLYTRTLEEARAFIDRSFSSYMGTLALGLVATSPNVNMCFGLQACTVQKMWCARRHEYVSQRMWGLDSGSEP